MKGRGAIDDFIQVTAPIPAPKRLEAADFLDRRCWHEPCEFRDATGPAEGVGDQGGLCRHDGEEGSGAPGLSSCGPRVSAWASIQSIDLKKRR